MANTRDESSPAENEHGKREKSTATEDKLGISDETEVEKLHRELEALRTKYRLLEKENSKLRKDSGLNKPVQTADGTLPPTKKIDETKIGFSDLSGEVRNLIYKYALVERDSIDLSSPDLDVAPYPKSFPTIKIGNRASGLLHVNWQIGYEAATIFFADNDFKVVNAPNSIQLVPLKDMIVQPSALASFAKRMLVHIEYPDPYYDDYGEIEHQIQQMRVAQLAYVVNTAKLLSHNISLVQLEFQITADYLWVRGCSRETVLAFIWPFVSLVRNVRTTAFYCRSTFDTNSWFDLSRREPWIGDVRKLFLYKCGDRSLATYDPEFKGKIRTLEEAFAKEIDGKRLGGEYKYFLQEVESARQLGKIALARQELKVGWPEWEESMYVRAQERYGLMMDDAPQ